MFIVKPKPAGAVTKLDEDDRSEDFVDLSENSVKLLVAQDHGRYANPDNARGRISPKPSLK